MVGVLSSGEGDDAPAITVTMRDVRCSVVNLDPDSASPAPEVLKAVVRANQNNAAQLGFKLEDLQREIARRRITSEEMRREMARRRREKTAPKRPATKSKKMRQNCDI